MDAAISTGCGNFQEADLRWDESAPKRTIQAAVVERPKNSPGGYEYLSRNNFPCLRAGVKETCTIDGNCYSSGASQGK